MQNMMTYSMYGLDVLPTDATRPDLVNMCDILTPLWMTKLLPGHDHLYTMYKYAGPDEIYPLSVTLTFELRTWVLRATWIDVVNICVK